MMANHRFIKAETKICSRCKIEKYISEYAIRKDRPCGTVASCKKCLSNYVIATRDKDAHAAYRRDYRKKTNKDKIAQKIRYRNRSSEKKAKEKVRIKEWRINHIERARGFGKKYDKNHPDVIRRAASKRRARVAKAFIGNINPNIEKLLFTEQGGKCPYCYRNLDDTGIHLDHYIPIALGGSHEDNNLQLLCPKCNRRKAAIHPHVFEASLLL